MLDLMGFKKEFVSLCRSTLFESGPVDIEIEERMVNKAQRGTLNGILFKKEGLNCAPTFYIEDFYNAYKAGAPVAELSHEAIANAVRSMDLADRLAKEVYKSFGNKNELRVRLLNKSRNKNYLEDKPFREAGCGFVFIAEIGRGEYGAVITHQLLDGFGMTEDELFDAALKNTVKDFPAVLQDLGDAVIGETEDYENLLDTPDGRIPAGAGPGFVLTNSGFYWGAGALFYPGMTARLHELLGGDFYVLPSSVHELILIAADDQDPQSLADMIRSANRSVVSENEILADDLYICESGELRRVSFGGVIPPCSGMLC